MQAIKDTRVRGEFDLVNFANSLESPEGSCVLDHVPSRIVTHSHYPLEAFSCRSADSTSIPSKADSAEMKCTGGVSGRIKELTCRPVHYSLRFYRLLSEKRCGTRAHRGSGKLLFVGRQSSAKKIPLAKHYNFVIIALTAVDHRGFIKVDEVDGRSPVERAAATFVPDLRRHCASRAMKSGVEFFAALGSSKTQLESAYFGQCDHFNTRRGCAKRRHCANQTLNKVTY